jgi:hypothetical protein
MIAFSSVNPQGKIQEFIFQLTSLENRFDVLSLFVGRNNKLLNTILIEGETETPSPLEAFDGGVCSPHNHPLEQQWKLQLSEPVNYNQRLHYLSNQRIQRHYHTITLLEQTVEQAGQRLVRVDEGLSYHAHHRFIIRSLESTLERSQHNLAIEQASLHQCAEEEKRRGVI